MRFDKSKDPAATMQILECECECGAVWYGPGPETCPHCGAALDPKGDEVVVARE